VRLRLLNALTATIAATAIAACGQLARPLAETAGASATAQPRGSTIADPAGISSGARALAAELAVLRRPQTPADLLPERAVRTLPEAIIPSLTRLVATGHSAKLGGFRVYLVVVTAAPCAYEKWPSGAPWGGDRVALITVSTRRPDRFETISMGFSARELELFAIVPVGSGEYWRGGGQVLSSVVPDGVTHVTGCSDGCAILAGRGTGGTSRYILRFTTMSPLPRSRPGRHKPARPCTSPAAACWHRRTKPPTCRYVTSHP
jgi:hypothetical protein